MPDWPDWTGEAVAIIASGPSTKRAEVESLKGRLRVLAIKKNVEIAPFADAIYGCDFPWWMSVEGLKAFKGWRFAYESRAVDQYGCQRVMIPDHTKSNSLLFDEVGTVGGGGCSGFQALNLVVQFGVSRVLLIGFDCQDRGGVHWYGRNTFQGQSNPSESNFRRWIPAFATAAEQLKQRGVEVVNASDLSALKCFRRQGVSQTLDQWGL